MEGQHETGSLLLGTLATAVQEQRQTYLLPEWLNCVSDLQANLTRHPVPMFLHQIHSLYLAIWSSKHTAREATASFRFKSTITTAE